MKKALLLAALAFALTNLASADEITFTFILGHPGTLTANTAGLTAGPAMNVIVSDATTGVDLPLTGTFTTHTGAAISFVTTPTSATGTYLGSGPLSVLIVDPSNNPLVSGSVRDDASFLSGLPDGAGAFLAGFDVSFVSPTVLAMFGLGPAFSPSGSESLTFAHDNFNGTSVVGQLGGGSVTIETPVTVITPEPVGLGIAGLSILAFTAIYRRNKFAA